MTILDRYIARTYLINVVMLFIILFSLVVVADYSLNFDEYTRRAAQTAVQSADQPSFIRRGVLSVLLVIDLWWPRFFQLYNYLLGIVMIGGMGFTLAQMVRHRELVAAIAGGISLSRLAVPFLVSAAILTALQVANRELVVPRLADLLTREKWNAGDRGIRPDTVPLTADAQGRRFYARSFKPSSGVIEGLWAWERNDDGLITASIHADRAAWDANAKAWRLTKGTISTRPRDRELTQPLESFATDLDPTTLTARRYESYSHNLSSAQLTDLITRYQGQSSRVDPAVTARNEERIARLERLRAARYSIMVCNLLALATCLPFFLRREPGNMLVQSIYCAPVAMLTVMGSTLAAAANIPGLPPALGAFLPVLAMLPLAIAAASLIKS